jgi:transcription antitermination factor NusG
MSWYALCCRVDKEIETEQALEARGITSYCPKKLIDKRKIMDVKKRVEALFPRYIFVWRVEGQDSFSEAIDGIDTAYTYVRNIREDGYRYPSPCHSSFIEALREHEDDQGIHSIHKADYEKGDPVIYNTGGFVNVPAEIYSIEPDRRVKIMLDMFGQSKIVTVNRRTITPS